MLANQHPDDPLPDPEDLRMTFDECVLQNHSSCNFTEGSDGRIDHHSQMMAFCGHKPWCKDFNSQRVLDEAKANVEKHYPVVGVIEELNKTLAVMEHEMPQYFQGAQKVTNSKITV